MSTIVAVFIDRDLGKDLYSTISGFYVLSLHGIKCDRRPSSFSRTLSIFFSLEGSIYVDLRSAIIVRLLATKE